MPIYEYACPDCGHQFDALQKFSDDPITDCPSCKAANVKKKISMTSFVLKGGGWYKDHYGLKSSGDSGGGDSGGTGGDGGASKLEGAKSESTKGEGASASTPAPAPAATPAPSAPPAAK